MFNRYNCLLIRQITSKWNQQQLLGQVPVLTLTSTVTVKKPISTTSLYSYPVIRTSTESDSTTTTTTSSTTATTLHPTNHNVQSKHTKQQQQQQQLLHTFYMRRRSILSSSKLALVLINTLSNQVAASFSAASLNGIHNNKYKINNNNCITRRNLYTMSSITTRLGDGTIVVAPKDEQKQNALIIISHGLGDSAEGFVDVAEQLIEHMPYCKFILPTAPTQPVTMNMGMSMPSWYDITGLDERSNENCKGIEDSYQRILDILDTEHNTYSLPYSRMVLAGFSQGAALSLFTGYQCPNGPLGGIVCMSGYLPALAKFNIRSELKSTPTLHCHGTQDMVVQYRMATKTQSKLVDELGVTNYTLQEYNIGHTVSSDEIQDVTKFLLQVLPDDPSNCIQLQDPSTMSVKQLKDAIRKAGLTQNAIGFMEKREYVQLLQDHRSGKL